MQELTPVGGGADRARAYRRQARDRPGPAPHHDAPPQRPVRLRAARASRCGSARSCACRSAARRSTASWSGSPSTRSCRPSGSWRRRGARGRRARRTSSSWRCGWRRSTARRRRARCSSCCRRAGKPRTEPWAFRTDAPLDGERLTDNQRALLDALPDARRPGSSRRCGGSRRAGSSRSRTRQRRRAPRTDARPSAPVALTADQEAAIAAVEAGGSHLLHGVTGSGKTEVYLRAAAAALERGEGVIVLVPEIALTPQTVGRFQARFGDTVALLHSALGEGERYDEWRRLRTGEARIAVGPRSAVFAPVADLGLVVVDEEHDASFKHEGDPRYDARTVAAERARAARARGCWSGTATPRPETVARAAAPAAARPRRRAPAAARARARHARRAPPAAPGDAPRAAPARASRSCCSTAAAGRTSSPAARAGRRGSARNCDVALVLHRAENAIACHHCGHRERVPERCDACGSLVGRPPRRRAPSASSTSCARASTCRSSGSTPTPPAPRTPSRSCSRASAPRPPGCCSAPRWSPRATTSPTSRSASCSTPTATLRFPDFRAEERTFALIAQLAGRAGRGRARRPRARADQRAGRARRSSPPPATTPTGFLAGELERRAALGYPPFADLIRVVCSAEDGAPARAAAGASPRPSTAPARTEVLGPAPLFRLRGRERFQVVVKTGERARGGARDGRGGRAAARDRAHRDVAFSVDVDPQ